MLRLLSSGLFTSYHPFLNNFLYHHSSSLNSLLSFILLSHFKSISLDCPLFYYILSIPFFLFNVFSSLLPSFLPSLLSFLFSFLLSSPFFPSFSPFFPLLLPPLFSLLSFLLSCLFSLFSLLLFSPFFFLLRLWVRQSVEHCKWCPYR